MGLNDKSVASLQPNVSLGRSYKQIRFSLKNARLNCKEITSMGLNDKSVASLQPNVSLGRSYKQIRFSLKTAVQPNNIAIRFNLRLFWPSIPSFVVGV